MRERLWWAVRSSDVVRRVTRYRLLSWLLRRLGYLVLPPSRHKILTVQSGLAKGLTLDMNPRWQQAMWQGTYEPSAQRVAADFFKPGTVIYDVGGGIGFYSLAAARLGARVFTFEPDPGNFARIERHASMNNLLGAFNLLPLAVFSRTGTIAMEPSQTGLSPGHAFAREVWKSDTGDRFDASCTTLDDFARLHPWPTLIKIDVEGCEAEVIRGAEWLMREARPAILCEVHDDALAQEAEAIVRSRGYRAEWLQDDGYHVRWLYATADGEHSRCAG